MEKDKNGIQKTFLFQYKLHGIPLIFYLAFALPVVIGMIRGTLGTDILSTMAMLFVIGIFFNELGSRLPIWNTWIGGGSMMAIMAPSFMVYMGWFPQTYVDSATLFYDDMSFLYFYIIILMAGSLLAVNRTHLLETLKRCGGVFLGAVAIGAVFGIVAGKLVGLSLAETLAYYVLPNLGGGNGAGAVPMSEIFNQVTGGSADAYYSRALALLTLGSTIALIVGVVCNKIGKVVPKWAGDGKTLLRDGTKKFKLEGAGEVEYKPSMTDIANGIVVAGGFYALANLFGKWLLPNIFGVIVHPLAYLILFLTLANVLNIIPENLRAGLKVLSEFIVEKMGPMCFAGMGIAITDFGEFVAAFSIQNLFVCFMIILGVALGAGITGWLVGFYPIDSIIAAGLTCSNRGDSADVILLGATGRMGLMPYAQVLSRLGGAVVLALSSTVFMLFF